jgi:hypothetical protein
MMIIMMMIMTTIMIMMMMMMMMCNCVGMKPLKYEKLPSQIMGYDYSKYQPKIRSTSSDEE